ncbi:hypothetical protein M2R48_19260 [Acinetobacter sp. I-MWF]|uniref:hypothetical protein n=1 Tax=Acinetobacter sp. I-MWF TaxID=2940517 RepID=UPI0021C8635F|nr:hypothetical protein [Acinetobacter sp. I-MWF]MCT9980463.1 hypothetical protein [Acinetobacter sp. I-MWF]
MTNIENINKMLFEKSIVIKMYFDFEDFSYNLILEIGSDLDDTKPLIILFKDISNFQINNFGGGLNQFMFSQITKNNDGLDRIKYSFEDKDREKVFFNFYSFEILLHY